MRARDRGFREGYREEVRVTHPSHRWMKGYAEGQAAAREDLHVREHGLFGNRPQSEGTK